MAEHLEARATSRRSAASSGRSTASSWPRAATTTSSTSGRPHVAAGAALFRAHRRRQGHRLVSHQNGLLAMAAAPPTGASGLVDADGERPLVRGYGQPGIRPPPDPPLRPHTRSHRPPPRLRRCATCATETSTSSCRRGYSQNQIVVWRYSSMQKVATLTGHTLRVLYLAMSPDGQTISQAPATRRSAFGTSSRGRSQGRRERHVEHARLRETAIR